MPPAAAGTYRSDGDVHLGEFMKSVSGTIDPTLPAGFIRSKSERPTVKYNEICKDIPVISLRGLGDGGAEHARIVEQVSRANEQWGIFQIVDHGITEDLIKRMRQKGEEFFAQPLEEKLKRTAKPGDFPIGYRCASHKSEDDVLDWKEIISQRCLPLTIRNYSEWPELEGYRCVFFFKHGWNPIKLSISR